MKLREEEHLSVLQGALAFPSPSFCDTVLCALCSVQWAVGSVKVTVENPRGRVEKLSPNESP